MDMVLSFIVTIYLKMNLKGKKGKKGTAFKYKQNIFKLFP